MSFPHIIGAIGSLAKIRGAAGGSGGPPPPDPPDDPSKNPLLSGLGKFAQLAFNFQIAANAIGTLGKAIIALPAAPIQLFSTAVGLLQAPVVAVVDALKGMVASVGAVGSAVSEFVRLSNPVYVQKFNMAMEDLTAVIGKALTPLLITSTRFVRDVADAFTLLSTPIAKLLQSGLKPLEGVFGEMFKMAAPLLSVFGTLMEVVGQIARPFAKLGEIMFKIAAFPIEITFNVLAKAVELVMAPLTVLARLFGDLMDAIGKSIDRVMNWVRDLLGIKSLEGKSVGAAVRPATFSSVEEYGKRAQQAAFSLGTAAGPEVRTANVAEMLYKYVTEKMWEDGSKKMFEMARGIIEAIQKLVPDVPSVGKIGDAGRDAGRRLRSTTASPTEFGDFVTAGAMFLAGK
jgi:hypothetical protein